MTARTVVTVDRDLCLGSESCARAVPSVFSTDRNGTVTLSMAEPPDSLVEAVRTAAFNCPAAAIDVSESAAE